MKRNELPWKTLPACFKSIPEERNGEAVQNLVYEVGQTARI